MSGRAEPPSAPVGAVLDVSAVPADPAGAGRYIVELARALGARPDVRLTLVTRRDDSSRFAAVAPRARVLSVVPLARPARLLYERVVLGRRVNGLDEPATDVYHGPHYTLPGALQVGKAVTVHDVTFLEHPEWHERSKVAFFRAAIARSVRQADVVVCVSRDTAERLRRLLAPAGEVVVAEHGVDHARFRPGPPDLEALPDGAEPGALVVYLGTLEPRKGVVDLVRAFDRLAGARPGLRLVLAGHPGWGAEEVRRAVSGAAHARQVLSAGFVTDATVVALLRAASVVVYPSHDEGFGLPALEALATGSPLVTTVGTAMSELAGEAAWLAPPGEPVQLARQIEAVLDASDGELAERRGAGLERARRYTWERTAALHVDAYREAARRARAGARGS